MIFQKVKNLKCHHRNKFLRGIIFCLLFLVCLLGGASFRLFYIPEVSAATNSVVGTFAKRSGTGEQTISGLGFQPKAIVFYWTAQTAVGAGSDQTNFYGSGFVDENLQEAAVSHWSDQALVLIVNLSTDSGRRTTEDASILIQSTDGTVVGQATVTSLTSDGFTLNWTVSNASGYIIRYMALGGADITDTYVSSFTLNTSAGTQAITAPAFSPDMIIFLSGGTASNNSTVANGKFSLGLASKVAQGGIGSLVTDGALLSDTCATQRDSALVLVSNSCNTLDALASVSSFDSSGFTINKSDTPAQNTLVYYLAIKGGSHAVIPFNSAATTGNQNINTYFQPNAMFLAGINKASDTNVSAHAYISLGAASAAGAQGAIASNDPDASLLITPKTYTQNGVVYSALETTSDTKTREAALVSFNTATTTINWSTNNGSVVQILGWVVGPNPNLNQVGYRFFENDNSLDVGSVHADQNTSTTLGTEGDIFRLRMIVGNTAGLLHTQASDFKLQYVEKGIGTCVSPNGTNPSVYTDVSAATHIAFYNNTGATDGATLIANVNDPNAASFVVHTDTYNESNNFTNNTLLPVQEAVLWDFALIDNTTSSNKYCLRIVYADGSILENYTVYPEIETVGHLDVFVVNEFDEYLVTSTLVLGTYQPDIACKTVTTTLFSDGKKIRVENTTANAQWIASMAPSLGPTASWAVSGTQFIDINDVDGCVDGSDTDEYAGSMTFDPTEATIVASLGCDTDGISYGSQITLEEGVSDSFTLLTAGGSADTKCHWDITNMPAYQLLPPSIVPGMYELDLTITLIAQ